MRLIDADALMKAMCHRAFETDGNTMWQSGYWVRYKAIEQIIKAQPTIKPEPKEGMWIERESGTEDKQEGWPTVIVCSQCDFPATTFYSEDCECRTQIKTHFCPHCGADMRRSKDACKEIL